MLCDPVLLQTFSVLLSKQCKNFEAVKLEQFVLQNLRMTQKTLSFPPSDESSAFVLISRARTGCVRSVNQDLLNP